MKKYNSIMFKIPLAIGIIILILCFAMLSITSKLASKAIENSTMDGFRTSVNGYSLVLDDIIDSQLIILQTYANIPQVINFMKSEDKEISGIKNTLTKMFDINSTTISLDFIDANGNYIVSYNGDKSKSGQNIKNKYPDLLNAFERDGKTIISANKIFKVNNIYILPVIAGIRDNDGTYLGAMISYIDWTAIIKKIVEGIGILSEDIRLFAVNPNLEVVFHNLDQSLMTSINDIKIEPSQTSGTIVYENSGTRIGFFNRLNKKSDWVIIESITEELLFAESRKIIFIGIIVGIIGFVISLAITVIYISKIISPIRNIVDEAHKMSEGNFVISNTKIKTKDEIGELYHSFEIMKEKLNFTIAQEPYILHLSIP